MSRKPKKIPKRPPDFDAPEGINPDDPFEGLEIDFGPPMPRPCTVCHRPKPPSAFNPQRAMCKECEARQPARKQQAEKMDRLQRGIHRLIAAAKAPQKAPTIGEIAAEMVGLFGGVKELCKAWYGAILVSGADGRAGTKTHLDQYYSIMKMIGMAQAEANEKLDLTEVSEVDLEKAIAGYVLKVVNFDDEEDESQQDVA